MSDLYETDVVTWSERQAALLRRIAGGERINDQVDWENIVEEIESVGQSQIDAVQSLLFQAFVHTLKAKAWQLARDVPGCEGEARGFRAQARRRYRPSMAQKIDLPGIYDDARQALPDTMDGQAPLAIPPVCPFASIEEFFSEP